MSENKTAFPFVSVCTPTFNRRPFIPALIQCFKNQNYPKDRIEWIVIDDGTDSVRDLFIDIECVKYYYFKDRMILGKKRNIMHSKCSGDIIIYMDDDDYYPNERISHAVETLESNKEFLMAGSSEMHLYFHDLNKIVQCGPYALNHSTAATFAFRKELLLETSYDESKALAEEKHFLKDYKIPVKQLDTLKTILVIAHSHNSYDKKLLLETPEACRITASRYKINDFIKTKELLQFYTKELHLLLECYSLGSPIYKLEILQQMEKTKIERANRIERAKQQQSQNNPIEQLKQHNENIISDKNHLINELFKKIKKLSARLEESNNN